MANQLKSVKHFTELAKEDIEDISKTVQDTTVNIKKNYYEDHYEDLKDINKTQAEFEADRLKAKAQAVKDVFSTEKQVVYCKHCGQAIDADSTFCKHCGGQQ